MSPPPWVGASVALTPSGAVAPVFGVLHWNGRRGHLPRVLGPDSCLGSGSSHSRSDRQMALILWIIAVILVVWGIVTLIRGQALMGIVLIIVGLLVGPGGVSIFT